MNTSEYSNIHHRKPKSNEFITIDVDPNSKLKHTRGCARGCVRGCTFCYKPCLNIFAYLFLLLVLIIKLQVIIYELYKDPVIMISLFVCNYIVLYFLMIYY